MPMSSPVVWCISSLSVGGFSALNCSDFPRLSSVKDAAQSGGDHSTPTGESSMAAVIIILVKIGLSHPPPTGPGHKNMFKGSRKFFFFNGSAIQAL